MFKFENFGIDKIEVAMLFSAQCNMACTYCYIPKDKSMKYTQKEVREYLESGKYVETIKRLSPEVKQVSFWGAEPTLNADLAGIVFKNILDNFESVNKFIFSTNLLVGAETIIDIIHALDESTPDGRETAIDIQISIDGPAWITDVTRHSGATEQLVSSIKEIINLIEDEEFTRLSRIKFMIKPTLTPEVYGVMAENPEKIEEWVAFFHDIISHYKKNISNKTLIQMPFGASPTIVSPGNYTSDDGKAFAKWLKESKKIDLRKYPGFSHPLYKGHLLVLEGLFNSSYLNLARSMECGAGNASYAIGIRGDVHTCHRSFNLEYFSKEIKGSKETLARLNNSFIAKEDEDEKNIGIAYTMAGYNDFESARISNSIAMIKMLAKAGQIEKIYLERDDLCDLLARLSYSSMCFLDSTYSTMSMHVSLMSMVRYFGNGALQEMLKDAYVMINKNNPRPKHRRES